MKGLMPEHARKFAGKARNIPAEDLFMLPYQARWISDRALMKLMEKSRRIGVTYGTSYDFVREHAQKGGTIDTWFSSRDILTAREFLVYCKGFARSLDAGARDLGEKVLEERHATQVLRFSNGSEINSMASNPDVFVGKGGNVGLDEFAVRDDPRGVYNISMPVIDWGGRMVIVSTHRGSANYFNELVVEARHKGNPKNISLHRVTLQDALDQGFLWKLQTKLRPGDPRMEMDEADYFTYQRARCADEEQFLQEYMCVPGDDNSAFLSYDLIAGSEYKIDEPWENPLEDCVGELFVGVDVGRDHDLTVIWVMEKLGGVYHTRKIVELKAEKFASQEAELYAVLAQPRVRRCCIDNTGIGKQFAERAQERFGNFKVEAVTFTAGSKEEMAYPLRSAFEDRALRIPNRNEIRSDLRSIRKETTASGNIRFAADRGKNGHADRFWALALALHAGKPAGSNYEMRIL